MAFLPGQSGNPNGRPKGTIGGRTKALQELDKFLSDENILQELKEGLKQRFKKSPFLFFKEIVMPLLPREAIINIFGDISTEHTENVSFNMINQRLEQMDGTKRMELLKGLSVITDWPAAQNAGPVGS